MVDRINGRIEQSSKSLNVIRNFLNDRLKIEEEYSEKLMLLGMKYRGQVESREEFCEYPPIFTTLIGDVEQMATARKQLREQIMTEIYLPLDGFIDSKNSAQISPSMGFVSASLAFRDFEFPRQQFLKETLKKLSVVNSILAESEDDISQRFGTDVESFNPEEFIQKLLKLDETFFPKAEQTKTKTKKGHRVTWSESMINVIGISETESKAPSVMPAQSIDDEEAFAEIASITSRKVNSYTDDDPEPIARPQPPPSGARVHGARGHAPDPLSAMDFFLANARGSPMEEEDNMESEREAALEREREREENERREREKERKEKEEQEKREQREKEEKEEQEKREQREKEEKEKAEKEKEEKEKLEKEKGTKGVPAEKEEKKKSKPLVPPKPSLAAQEAEETTLRPIISETLSCHYVSGQLQRCDLTGQISFAGSIRKDFRSEFSFDLNDTTNVENILPNKTFVQTSPDEGLGFKCNARALSHYIQPHQPVPALKYRVLGSSVANKIPLLLSVAWKCEPTTTSILISYKGAPNLSITLLDVVFEVVISGEVEGIQAKPQPHWNAFSQTASWNLGTIELSPEKEFSGKVLGRFSVQQQSTPAPVSLRFNCTGISLSDIQVELSETPEIKWQPIFRSMQTGKYLAS